MIRAKVPFTYWEEPLAELCTFYFHMGSPLFQTYIMPTDDFTADHKHLVFSQALTNYIIAD